MSARGGPNLVHPKATYLPDAPDLVVLDGDFSPYHELTITLEERFRAEKAIRVMAVACVRDHQKSVKGHLDFTPESIKLIDEILNRVNMGTYDESSTRTFVAELGSYIGAVIESESFGTEIKVTWHTCPVYYFSALRIRTKSNRTLETNPFAWVTKRLVSKEGEVELFPKFQVVWGKAQE